MYNESERKFKLANTEIYLVWRQT